MGPQVERALAERGELGGGGVAGGGGQGQLGERAPEIDEMKEEIDVSEHGMGSKTMRG